MLALVSLCVLVLHALLLNSISPRVIPAWPTSEPSTFEMSVPGSTAPEKSPPQPKNPPLQKKAPLPEIQAAGDKKLLEPPPPAMGESLSAAASDSNQSGPSVVIPRPVRLKYGVRGKIRGFPYGASGELLWQHDGKNYNARLEISIPILMTAVQTSKGAITPRGLEPLRFGDKRRSEVAAHFQREKGIVSFSANTPDAILEPGAQDQLSLMVQLAAMLAGNPKTFVDGTDIHFQTIGPRTSESWTFTVGKSERLELPGGKLEAIRLTRPASPDNDSTTDLWFAPELDYLPVQVRISQSNGDYVEQQWESSQEP